MLLLWENRTLARERFHSISQSAIQTPVQKLVVVDHGSLAKQSCGNLSSFAGVFGLIASIVLQPTNGAFVGPPLKKVGLSRIMTPP